MDFTELYAQKKMTAAQAAALVKSGDWVDYGWAVNTPVAVDAEIAKRLPELEGVNFRGGILMWVPAIFQIDDPAAHMTWNSWHMGGIERKAIAQGFSFYSPIRYSELPRYYRESPDPLDVAVFQVTPMDEHGYFNFGPSASHLGAVCEKAKKIIVEVNKNMPRCLGGMENCIHISQVTGIVEGENPPIGQMAAPGAATEVEMKEKKLRIDDALSATRAAVEEGYVPGGGTALLSAIPSVKKLVATLSGDEKTGAAIVLKALEEPIRQIAKNAGFDGSVIVDKVVNAKKANFGFDALNNKYCDMVESGIIDPTKVTRSVLQNAASVAATLLTTESVVTDIPTPPAPAAPAGGDMGGMY